MNFGKSNEWYRLWTEENEMKYEQSSWYFTNNIGRRQQDEAFI